MQSMQRSRLNWINGSTLLGLALARAGGVAPRRGPDGLWLAEGHGLPTLTSGRGGVFTVGDVILHPCTGGLAGKPALLRHESVHAEQYARFGLAFLPLWGLSALASWVLTGDRASANPFERRAGLADGGYPPARRRPHVRRRLL